ncbi:type II toxin-antitoxin system RelE/ParE family toxin [Desulfovibrio sp. OttesenSCG-928-M14]|nr:type II toxin-antitoxin system RelE/ParE family toxin [Desulfovibrio sp. OttesenSCG-928-M14]
MEFIETSTFTRQILALLTDDEYRLLQFSLAEKPEQGDVIKNSGGLRKIRVAAGSKGKSGGIRVIYYWITGRGQIFMLLAYPKNKKDDLSADELSVLKTLVERELGHG